MPRRTFTIFLAKDNLDEFPEFLTENAQAALDAPSTQDVDLEDFAERAKIVVFRGNPSTPKWLRGLAGSFDGITPFNTFSGAAVLFFQIGGATFAVTFSHGWMYLDEDKFAADFGLRVAVNGLDHSKLRRLERSNLGDALKGVSQSAFQREFRSFGIDDALELVQKISGATKDEIEADSMVGSRSLKITGEYDYVDLPELAAELLELYSSESYRETEFRVIDSVQPIADGVLVRRLNGIAATRIRLKRDSFELGLPSSAEVEGIAFKFHGPGLRHYYPDLLLRHYTTALESRGKLADLDAEMLDNHKIEAIIEEDRPSLKWSIRKALIGSVSSTESRYAINEGVWYRIDDLFRISVENNFTSTVTEWQGEAPTPIMTKYDANGNGTLERELDYNTRLAEQFGFALLDTEEITVPNVTRSGFEPCDLLDVENRRFIHVKKSSRSSSVLSHFFKQGSNSARQFKRIPNAWTQLEAKLNETGQKEHAERLAKALGEGGQWSVEYWIVDTPRANGQFNIPFFSKISLRDEKLDMNAMEYTVRLRFIRKEPESNERFER